MDTGAECDLLPLDVYKEVTGDVHLNFLDLRGKSVFVLANGEEKPIDHEGKATIYVVRAVGMSQYYLSRPCLNWTWLRSWIVTEIRVSMQWRQKQVYY